MAAIRVFFDNNEVDGVNIIGLRQSAHSLNDNFILGGTVCRTFELDVLKGAVATHPTVVKLQDGNDVYADKLVVYGIDDTNDAYYKYKLADQFVNMGKQFDYSSLTDPTADDVLGLICTRFGFSKPSTYDDGDPLYALDYPAAINSSISPRSFIGMLAELNAGYAYIDSNGNLQFAKYTSSVGSISKDVCSSYKIGLEHKITRVVFDALAHYERGDQTGETVYLNTDNILFTDSGSVTIETAVDHIYPLIKDFSFYNIQVEKCPVLPNIRAGQCIDIGGQPTIVQIEWTYNGTWLGGYELDLEPVTEQETQVKNDYEEFMKQVQVIIDRQDGTIDLIGTKVSNLERNNIHFQVNAEESEVRVTNQETYSPTSYTAFKGDGMRIYVNGERVAEATALRFECDKGLGVQDWAIEQGKSENTLIFYRKA